ncbi:MAG: hypothetical protein DWQ36_19885 [Acidobacteria bacterium]|nr:MAG: hypothetical protein DWQ30_02880 [Acidobacteriota bacterium]REK03613.1 MAG: hypothetical protein DWQ36_19885 [Acidobacteriota bacterium]
MAALLAPIIVLLVAPVVDGQVVSVSDPSGDVLTPTAYYGLPFGGPVDISGNQIEWTVPDVLLPPLISNWLAASSDPVTPFYDLLPDVGVINTTGGTVGDPQGDTPLGIHDLTSATILESAEETLLRITVRQLEDPGPTETTLAFGLNFPMGGGTPDTWTAVFPLQPSADGWGRYVAQGTRAFPYAPSSYYDIVFAEADYQAPQLQVTLRLAADLPALAPETTLTAPYTPVYRVGLDVDADAGTGDALGNDHLLTAYFAPNGLITALARTWTGAYFEVTGVAVPQLSVSGDELTLTIDASALGLADEFSWQAAVDLAPYQPGENDPDGYWFSNVDLAARRSVLVFRSGFENGLQGWTVFP